MQGISISVSRHVETAKVVVISVNGYVDTTTAPELRKVLTEQVAEGWYQVVIDLKGVDYISSTGWGVFVGELKDIRANMGDLVLAGMVTNVHNIYELMEFSSIIKSFEDKGKAMAYFADKRGGAAVARGASPAPPVQAGRVPAKAPPPQPGKGPSHAPPSQSGRGPASAVSPPLGWSASRTAPPQVAGSSARGPQAGQGAPRGTAPPFGAPRAAGTQQGHPVAGRDAGRKIAPTFVPSMPPSKPPQQPGKAAPPAGRERVASPVLAADRAASAYRNAVLKVSGYSPGKAILKVIRDKPYYGAREITKALELPQYGGRKVKPHDVKRELKQLGLFGQRERYEFAIESRPPIEDL